MQSLFQGFQPHQLGSSQIQSIIEQLGSPDIMFQFEGVNSLRNMLAIAQESQLSRSQFEQLSQKLVNILNEQAIEEIQSEIKLAAIQSLIQMLDISPNHINYLLQLGITKALKETIETSSALGYIDLVEQCIGCLTKISEEVPREILRHNLVPIPINMIDFFDKSTQLKILALLLNISTSIDSRNEFEQNILVMLHPIQQLLQQWSCSDADKDKFEKLTTVIQRVTKCFSRMVQAKVPEVKALHEELGQAGLYNLIADLLRSYTQAAQQMETDAINTSSKKLFSKTAVSNLLLILQRPCTYSAQIAAQLIDLGIFQTLNPLVPANESEQHDASIIQDTLVLMQELVGSSTISKAKEFTECADAKQQFLKQSPRIDTIAQTTVPRLFVACSLLSQNEHKERVLQLLCVLLREVDAQKFTKFCYTVLRSQQPGQVHLCLQLIRGVKCQNVADQFRRFGVQATIQMLTDKAEVDKICAAKASEPEPVKRQEDYHDIVFREHAQILKITEVQKQQVEARLLDFQKKLDELPDSEEKTKADLREQVESLRMKIQHLDQATEELRNLPKLHASEQSDSELSFHEPASQQTDMQTKIIELATEIQASHFNSSQNENSQLSKLQSLATQISKAVESSSTDRQSWHPLFQDLKQTLLLDLTTFEFQESGLLKALNTFLSNEREPDEESKSDVEPEGHLQRLALFYESFHYDEKSLKNLVSLLQDQISEAEKDLFPHSGSETDIYHSIDALQQLQRPIIIELVYRKSDQQPFQSLQASQQSQLHKVRDALFTKLGKIPIQISKADNCLLLSDFLLRKVRTERDVQDLLDRFARMPCSRKKIDPANAEIELEGGEKSFFDELFQLMLNLVQNSVSQHVFIQSRAKFTEQSMVLIRKFEGTGAFLSNKFWDKLMSATAKAIKEHTLPPNKDGQASEAETELLLAQIEVKTEAFLNLVQAIKNKSRPPPPPKKEEKDDVSMDEVLDNSEKVKEEEAEESKSNHSKDEDEEEEPEDDEHDEHDPEGSDDYYEEQPVGIQDVEMTEEIGAKSQNSEDEEMSEHPVANQPLALEPKPSKSDTNATIDELVRQGAEDVEIEIYFQGQQVDSTRPVFELLRSSEEKQEKPRAEERQSIISQLLGSLRGGADMRTLEFSIKDKPALVPLQKKNSLIEYQKSRTKSLVVEDTPEYVKKQTFKVQVQQKDLKEALQVLKVLHFLRENPEVFSGLGVQILGGSEAATQSEKAKFCLQHAQIDRLFQRQIQDPYHLVTGGLPETLKTIFESCQFLFSYETRQLYLRCVQLIPVDLNRSITFLRAHLKSQGKQAQEEDPRKRERQERQRVKIDRSKSFVKQMLRVLPDLKGRALLEVLYKDEEGTGLGPTLEFYATISKELKENKLLWRQNVPNGALFPKAGATEAHLLEQYKVAGYLIARAIFDDKLVDLPFSRTMWDLLLQRRKMSIFDLQHLDPSLYDLMLELQLMACKIANIKKTTLGPEAEALISDVRSSRKWKLEDYSLFFYDPSDDKIELVEGGLSLPVTADNLQQYIDLVLDSIFNNTVQSQLHSFKKGFELVMPLSCLSCLQTNIEIERLVCGQLGYDGVEWQIKNLEDVVQTAHGFNQHSQAFRWFLQYMSEMDPKKRPQFIQFITGSARLPHGGLGALDPRLTVVMKKGAKDSVLPSVMTCQNYVKMPDYSSYAILCERFTTAVEEGSSNFTLS